jgi:hypothetical protein
MDPSDRSEIIIAGVIFGVYIAFVLTRHICNTIPGLCTASWVVFGVIVIIALIFIMAKIFMA